MPTSVVESFLHTVVVVDDQAELNTVAEAEEPEQPNALAQSPEDSSSRPHAGLQVPRPQPTSNGHALEAKTLIDGFAEKGLVCAVLKPGAGEDAAAKLVRAAHRSDIVILDWLIHDDDGQQALELIKSIEANDAQARRLRLIVIYSGDPAIAKISERIHAELGGELDSGGYSIVKGPIRMSVFAKEGVDIPDSERITPVRDLPDRVVREFATMTKGLLAQTAVAGLAALRGDMHRLLSVFSSQLDPAYLGHRILLENPQDAEDHLVSVLAAEIRAILGDSCVGESAGMDQIERWIDEAHSAGVTFEAALPPTPPTTPAGIKAMVADFLRDGLYHDSVKSKLKRDWNWAQATGSFLEAPAAAHVLNCRFAQLLHLKNRYGTPAPTLTLGTVLLRLSDETYWLCMQPKCDSVRLGGPAKFPLLPLAEANSEKDDFQVVVQNGDDWRCLKIPLRLRELEMFTFSPDPVRHVVMTGDDLIFSSEQGQFKWIAELKDEHAQRAANDFAANASRVGLDESEWVRRSGRKQF